MKRLIVPALLLLLAILVIYGFNLFGLKNVARPGIKIGVLHSLSGTMATSEAPLVTALQLGIEEANAAGGINGRQIEAVVVDCRSDDAYCARQTERLIVEEKIDALFGCWTSSCRKSVKPVVEKYHHLLFYPLQYEGVEDSPNIVYTGAAPNQQIIPATNWALKNLGKRVYLVGSDYIFPRMANIFIKDIVKVQSGVVLGERYLPLGSSAMDAVVADIARQQPQLVLNTLNGDSNAYFFAALEKAGLSNLPLMSFSVGADGMKALQGQRLHQHFGAWNYFQSLPGQENSRFVSAYHDRFGADKIISDPMESSYVGFKLWVQAAQEAGSPEVAEVQRTISRQTLSTPEGMVAIDPETRHLWKTPRIGKVTQDGQFEVVWEAAQAIKPAPFPVYRFQDEWQLILSSIGGAQP